MKKLLLLLIGITLLGGGYGVVVRWYAVADAMMEVIMVNARYTKRELAFDYDQLIVESDWLRPTIRMTNPAVQFATVDNAKYRLTATEVTFISPFLSLGEYRIELPEQLLLEQLYPQSRTFVLNVKRFPEVRVRSSESVEEKPAEAIYLDEFRVEKFVPLVLEANQQELRYTPPEFMTFRWMPVHYQVSGYLQKFQSDVQGVAGDASPLP